MRFYHLQLKFNKLFENFKNADLKQDSLYTSQKNVLTTMEKLMENNILLKNHAKVQFCNELKNKFVIDKLINIDHFKIYIPNLI